MNQGLFVLAAAMAVVLGAPGCANCGDDSSAPPPAAMPAPPPPPSPSAPAASSTPTPSAAASDELPKLDPETMRQVRWLHFPPPPDAG